MLPAPGNKRKGAFMNCILRKSLKLWPIVLCIIPSLYPYAPPSSPRTKFNFNCNWRYIVQDVANAEQAGFNDNSWKTCSTPHTFEEDNAFKMDGYQFTGRIAWYRKHFKIPSEFTGKKVFIEFEGIRQAGEFYVNGTQVGRHENGITGFGFDITSRVNFGSQENVLAVKINSDKYYKEVSSGTQFQWQSSDQWGDTMCFNVNYGGISKNVFLHLTDSVYQTLPLYSDLKTTGLYIYAENINIAGRSANITVQSQVKNESKSNKKITFEAILVDTSGTVRLTLSDSATINANALYTFQKAGPANSLSFWDIGSPYLYRVYIILSEGDKIIDVVKTYTGFRKTAFGSGRVTFNDRVIFITGYSQRTTNEWPALGDAVPPWMSDLSNKLMADGNAKVVRWMHVAPKRQDVESCDRVGLIQAMPCGDKESDVSGRQWEQRKEVMRDAMISFRNNPSIVFYEVGNAAVSETHMKEMVQLRDQWDPKGGRAIGCRDMQGSASAEYAGSMEDVDLSSGKPVFAQEYMRDEGHRRWWDQYSPPAKHADGPQWNRNQDSHALEAIRRWVAHWLKRPFTQSNSNAGGLNILFSDSNTHHRGEDNYRRSGEVDAMRLPKESYYAHKVMWRGSLDTINTDVHIIGHWNYAAGVKKNVYVVSNCQKVKLFVNNVDKGFGVQSNHWLYTFSNIDWESGTIRAVGYDSLSAQKAEATKATAGSPVGIALTAMTGPTGLRANGADIALIDAKVVDDKGNQCPTEERPITFSVSGPAVWRGGIAHGANNFILEKTLASECGITRVSIRSTPVAGSITVNASTQNIPSASVSLNSQPVDVQDGLSLEMPAAVYPGKDSSTTSALPDVQPPPLSRPLSLLVKNTNGQLICFITGISGQAGLEVFNAQGKCIRTRMALKNAVHEQRIVFPSNGFLNGIYIFKVSSAECTKTAQILLCR
jgi:beta-galactosidase